MNDEKFQLGPFLKRAIVCIVTDGSKPTIEYRLSLRMQLSCETNAFPKQYINSKSYCYQAPIFDFVDRKKFFERHRHLYSDIPCLTVRLIYHDQKKSRYHGKSSISTPHYYLKISAEGAAADPSSCSELTPPQTIK